LLPLLLLLCRTEVDALIERRVRDFRLDSRLRGACAGTISQLCADLGDAAVVDTYDGAVANCLQVWAALFLYFFISFPQQYLH
jgi:Golgi apparatus protein 1